MENVVTSDVSQELRPKDFLQPAIGETPKDGETVRIGMVGGSVDSNGRTAPRPTIVPQPSSTFLAPLPSKIFRHERLRHNPDRGPAD